MSAAQRNIVIVGGGIIGSTTAYFLTRHAHFNRALHSITLIEASSVAAGSSGKAGGLLAEWAYPECITQLSYDLHARLANEHGGDKKWGYRHVSCGTVQARVTQAMIDAQGAEKSAGQMSADGAANSSSGEAWKKLPKQNSKAKSKLTPANFPADLDYISPEVVTWWDAMDGNTAQVHPFHFTSSMAEMAADAGVKIVTKAKVTKILYSDDGKSVVGVEYVNREDETVSTLDATDVVVTAGPWTSSLIKKAEITSVRAHSVVYNAEVAPYAVFTGIDLPQKWTPAHRKAAGQQRKHSRTVDPEVYARPFGEVYACGETDSRVPLPEFADEVQFDEAQCDDIIAYMGLISPQLRSATIKTKQACYLPQHSPITGETDPLIGPSKITGLFIAAGHTCWGIQNGPATGCLMAEYIFDGKTSSANVKALEPRKFGL